MTSTPGPQAERGLLDAARRGDELAYRRLVEPYQRELRAYCYRMLGSVHDAEDALQEALLGAWRGLPRFEGRSSLRTWLYTITTNACRRQISRRPRRLLTSDHVAAGDPRGDIDVLDRHEARWVEPCPEDQLGIEPGFASPAARYEQRESVELAFVATLQHLPASQRAVLILREVLAFSASEVAETLGTTVASVNSALQRARKTLDARMPVETQRATRQRLGDDEYDLLVERFVNAWDRNDVHAIVALLAEDATFTMPPLPVWFDGRDDIEVFLTEKVFAGPWRFVPTRANGQPAMAGYQWDAQTDRYHLGALNVLSWRGTQVVSMTAFLSPDAQRPFGLPDEPVTAQ